MIKLNDNKTKSNLLKLINREISFIDASLAYQRSLNKEVLLCMNLITQNSEVIETAMEFSKNYEALNNVMALLKKSTFNQRRKTLANGLKNSQELNYTKEQVESAITECGLPLNIRGEALTLEQFAKLSDIFHDMK